MRATIKNYMEAANRRREEQGEEGFSLIELIIVVVILGILVAIAIPIFSNLQATAQQNAVDAAAADAAVAVAAALADDDAATTPLTAVAPYSGGDITVADASGAAAAAITATSFGTIDNVCIVASGYGTAATPLTGTSGPGC